MPNDFFLSKLPIARTAIFNLIFKTFETMDIYINSSAAIHVLNCVFISGGNKKEAQDDHNGVSPAGERAPLHC